MNFRLERFQFCCTTTFQKGFMQNVFFATRRTSQVKFTTKAPNTPPTGPVERTLFLGPTVGTLVTIHLLGTSV